MYDHWTSTQPSLATAPLAYNTSPSQQRPVTTSIGWTSYRERRASTSYPRLQLARSPSSISNERGEHGSHQRSVSRLQTPPSRPPSPFRSIKRTEEPLTLLSGSHSSTGSTPDAPILSKAITTTSEACVEEPLQNPKTTKPLNADSQPSRAVSLLRNSSANVSHNIECSIQSAPTKNHKGWSHALSCPCSPPRSPCEELCIVPDYEDHTPKIEIIEPLESVCDSSSSCCSEENYRIPSLPLLSKGSRPVTPQQVLCNSELPLRAPASLYSLVDLPKLQAGPGWLSQGKDCETWVEETLKASRELNFSRPRKVKNQRAAGVVADVPRLWIKVDEDVAEKDSLRYATVVTPTKPRVVTIPRHNSSTGTSPTTSSHYHALSVGSAFDFDIGTPAGGLNRTRVEQDGPRDGAIRSVLDKSSLTATHMQRSVHAISCHNSSVTSLHSSSLTCEVKPATASLPHTPPQTPHRGRPRNRSKSTPIKATVTDNDKANTAATSEAHPITPPQSPITSPQRKPLSRKRLSKRMHSSTTRRPTRLVTSATYPSHFVSDLVDLSWILSELETSITAFPCTMLQLDSPVVQHFRSCQGSSTSPKTETAQVLRRPSLISPPHSRYSPLQPSKISSQHQGSAQTNESPTFPSQNPLRAVFPGAPAHLLDALHATTIALNHVCEIMASIPSPNCTSTLTKTRRSSAVYHVSRSPRRFRGPLDLTGIAPKARRMLGIPRQSLVSFSAAPPSSESPPWEHENKPEGSKPSEHGLKERGEKVRGELGDMSRWLVEEIGKRTNNGGSERRDGTLLTALGEIVRLGDKPCG